MEDKTDLTRTGRLGDVKQNNPSTAPSVSHFQEIARRSQCPFANTAKLWGNPEWRTDLSLEENIDLAVPDMKQWIPHITGADPTKRIMHFVLEVVGADEFCCDLVTFGATVLRVLRRVSGHDPQELCCMESAIAGQVQPRTN